MSLVMKEPLLSEEEGDCEDHANLLCSLLLGYGLEAFVCVGTKAKGVPHAWVMTCGTDGTITFWESLTGHRYIHKPINPDEPPLAEQPKHCTHIEQLVVFSIIRCSWEIVSPRMQ
uniref:Centrosomal protein of 76 kDa-like n=1 Tax=Castor canadensis TaxID=51338 RepID=A0A8B7U1Y5_CASCN|nr:centrosomal protein of 76 kDa-like [Castor canadensis]